MAFENIRNKIKSKLESIDSIQEVFDYPTMEFKGYPATVVVTDRLESAFETTTQNRRVYIFKVFVFQQTKVMGLQKARRIIEGVVDDIIEAFDKDQLLSGISLPSNEAMIISYPLLSGIYADDEEKFIIGELEIKVVVSFDIK